MYSVSRKNSENAAAPTTAIVTFAAVSVRSRKIPQRQQRRLRAKLDHDERDHQRGASREQARSSTAAVQPSVAARVSA